MFNFCLTCTFKYKIEWIFDQVKHIAQQFQKYYDNDIFTYLLYSVEKNTWAKSFGLLSFLSETSALISVQLKIFLK